MATQNKLNEKDGDDGDILISCSIKIEFVPGGNRKQVKNLILFSL